MKLLDAHNLIVSEIGNRLRHSNENKVDLVHEHDIASMFYDIILLCNNEFISWPKSINKWRAINHLKKNKLVNSLEVVKPNMYRISTEYGDGVFFDSRIPYNGQIPGNIKSHRCYENTIKQMVAIDQTNPTLRPALISGIVESPIDHFKPFLHCVYSIEENPGHRMIVDFNYNIQMTEELYKNLVSFEVLNEATIFEINKLWKNYWKYRSNNPDTKNKEYPASYMALATRDMNKYFEEVMKNERQDDFYFVNELNYHKYKKLNVK